ncbi:major facilitator superfamily domain-containing protein [Aspergillus keveii]|uniref:Major facilitator superfamily domain-containing protein n=1 Tax=Aspergillus keveii TaxID=714993 RepID=A0ABR4FK28_9EURO
MAKQSNGSQVASDMIEDGAPEPCPASATDNLSEHHKNYLLERHGTVDLDPLPTMDPADPLNWPKWKKKSNLWIVSFLAFMATFTATSIIPAFLDIATDLGVTIQDASYLTSAHIALVGVAPLFWRPLSKRFGRRPVFVGSTLLALVCNLGCAKSYSYGAMMACRVLGAFFISPAMALGSAVVTETFFSHERAQNMGIWTLMLTVGVPIGPLVFGPVVTHIGYRWSYWILASLNGFQVLLYSLFGPETLYHGGDPSSEISAFKTQYLSVRRIDPTPFTMFELFRPLRLFLSVQVSATSMGYAVVFLFASILCSVEIPSLLQQKFRLSAEQLGFQFAGIIIGSVLGEILVGRAANWWRLYMTRKLSHSPSKESRLWISYLGYVLSCLGIVVFLVFIPEAPEADWTVTPIVGTGIAAFGNQIVGTVLTTYAVDVHREDSASVGVFVNIVRSLVGFIGPFWFPPVFDNVGTAPSAGIFCAIIFGVGILPTILVHCFVKRKGVGSCL